MKEDSCSVNFCYGGRRVRDFIVVSEPFCFATYQALYLPRFHLKVSTHSFVVFPGKCCLVCDIAHFNAPFRRSTFDFLGFCFLCWLWSWPFARHCFVLPFFFIGVGFHHKIKKKEKQNLSIIIYIFSLELKLYLFSSYIYQYLIFLNHLAVSKLMKVFVMQIPICIYVAVLFLSFFYFY